MSTDPHELTTPAGIPVTAMDELNDEDHGRDGIVYAWLEEGRWTFTAGIRSDLTDGTDIAGFIEWVDVSAVQLDDEGDPDRLGWFPSDLHPGRWYMTSRRVQLPPLD